MSDYNFHRYEKAVAEEKAARYDYEIKIIMSRYAEVQTSLDTIDKIIGKYKSPRDQSIAVCRFVIAGIMP